MARFIATKRVVISEKCSIEDSTSLPRKRGETVDNSKGKKAATMLKVKKKVIKPSSVASSKVTPTSKPREGTSASLGIVLGPRASILSSPSVVKKILRAVIPPANKEKVEQLTLEQMATRFFHVIFQVLPRL